MRQSSIRRGGLVVAVALLLVLAGCNAISSSGTPTGDATETPTATESGTDSAVDVTDGFADERTLNAAPFQRGATTAANFLLAPNETRANTVLDENAPGTRYVAVDWQTASTYTAAGGNYSGLVRLYTGSNVSVSDYYDVIIARQNPDEYFISRRQAYYESMAVRLYQFHGSAKEPRPFVVDWETATIQDGQTVRTTPSSTAPVKPFPTMAAARNYTQNDSTSQLGGLGAQPGERVAALEHYRYVRSSERSAYASGAHNRYQLIESAFGRLPSSRSTTASCPANTTTMPVANQTFCMPDDAAAIMTHTHPAWTKLFERVPGGTIEGTAPANLTIRASVPMRNEVTGESFTYSQQADVGADGRFELTVPYSTTGYDEWGTDEGGTTVHVRAEGPYQFSVPVTARASVPLNGTAQVTEGQVLGETQTVTSVTLTVPETALSNATAAP